MEKPTTLNFNEINEDWEEWNPENGSFLSHMIAGSAAGVVEHVSIFPIDTIKTHMQCKACPANISSNVQNIQNKKPRLSAIETTKELIQKEGVGRLFRGVSAMFGASIPAHAAYFSIFEFCKSIFGADSMDITPLASGGAGVCATIAHDMIMTPLDVVKQRLQLGYYSGTINCLRMVLKREGIQALYLSFPTTFLMNIPYSMIMVSTNESIKKILNPSNEQNIQAYLVSGAISGATAAALTNPLDVAKTRLQTQSIIGDTTVGVSCPRTTSSTVPLEFPSACGLVNNFEQVVPSKYKSKTSKRPFKIQYKGLYDALKKIKIHEGYNGFFQGMWPRIFVHAPSVAVSWTAYEVTKKFLGKLDI